MQLQYSCEQHLSVLAAMHDVGDSLSKCLALIAKLNDFEKLSKVSSFQYSSFRCIITYRAYINSYCVM